MWKPCGLLSFQHHLLIHSKTTICNLRLSISTVLIKYLFMFSLWTQFFLILKQLTYAQNFQIQTSPELLPPEDTLMMT